MTGGAAEFGRGIVEIDDHTTWPLGLTKVVDALLQRAGTRYPNESGVDAPNSDFLDAINGAAVRLYHCTNLLPADLASIRDEGLLPFDDTRATQRAAAALATGRLNDHVARTLRRAISKAAFEATARPRGGGNSFLFTNKSALRERGQVENLLAFWGGETLYGSWSTAEAEMLDHPLFMLGTPVVLSVAADPALARDVWPNWLYACTPSRPGEGVMGAVVTYDAPIPASGVTAWTPDTPEWAEHVGWTPDDRRIS